MNEMELFKEELNKRTQEINERIAAYLPKEQGLQKTVLEAMNYSMNAGGKRLRPMLMQEISRLFTGEVLDVVEPFMAAIEMIHTSSLVHDDLPCMDDDRMRRGKASTWAEFGEDMGVLAGDALMIYAFETASKAFEKAEGEEGVRAVGRAMQILARKTGIFGMIGGQTADVELSGSAIKKSDLDFIYRLKTGALLEASMMIGAVLVGAADEDCKVVERLASRVGLAFQIQDDILDVTGKSEETGKSTGNDARSAKTTYVTLEGVEQAKKEVAKLSEQAIEDLGQLPGDNEFLEKLIRVLVSRKK